MRGHVGIGWVMAALGCVLACGPTEPPGGPGLPGAPPPPPAGRSTGKLVATTVDSTGGSVTLAGSAGGSITLTVPAGAVAQATTFTIDEVSPNTAYGGVGSAYRLGPKGTALSKAITLTLIAPPGQEVSSLTAAYQDALGYWFRVYSVRRDATASSVQVDTTYLGDWSLATVATQRDLHGPVRLQSTQGVPFTAQADVVLQFIGEYDADIVYVPTGSLQVLEPVSSGTANCTVDAPNPYVMHASVAELHKSAPNEFRWGINGQWNLTCDDGTKPFISTNFDTLGITNSRCTRAYVGTAAVVDPTHVRGRYQIDCGDGSMVTASWELVPPDQMPGALP